MMHGPINIRFVYWTCSSWNKYFENDLFNYNLAFLYLLKEICIKKHEKNNPVL